MRLSYLFFGVALAAALACAGGEPAPDGGAPAAVVTAVPAAPPPPDAAASSPGPAAAPLPAVDIPFYSAQPLDPAALRGLSLRELTLWRNTIYARAGQPFVKTWLREHFRGQPWYTPALRADLSLLSPVDRDNAKRIVQVENGLSRAELVSRRDAVLARARAGTSTDADAIELLLLARRLGEDAWSYEEVEGLVESGHWLDEDVRTPIDDPRLLDRPLAEADLAEMSRRDLRLLRNLVYARHGRPFTSDILRMYFENMPWYTADPAYTEARLTEADRRNIQLIQTVEARVGGPLTEGEHRDEYGPDGGWFWGA
jgi:hypothetical protein